MNTRKIAKKVTMSIKLTGNWKLKVSLNGISKSLRVQPPEIIEIKREKYILPEFKQEWGGWMKGARLKGLIAQECTAKGALDPLSPKVVSKDGVVYKQGRDYEADLEWGTFGRLTGGRIKADQPVFINYRYGKLRLDSIVLGANGKLKLVKGKPDVAVPEQPAIKEGEIRLANIFIEWHTQRLSSLNIYPVLETSYPEPPKPKQAVAEKLLPKTMKKLKSGKLLRVLAWGDSVTDGSFLPDQTKRWQVQFIDRLKQRFPGAKIKLYSEGWSGHNTSQFLAEPAGSVHNYKEKVLALKPDLIVSEFVNDGWMNLNQTEKQYGNLLNDFKALGIEWIILTPHYIRTDWMGLKRQYNIDKDPRPYVKALRKFAAKKKVPLADASLRWGRLWRQGIPYNTFNGNAINHPDKRGMKFFADALMWLFP